MESLKEKLQSFIDKDRVPSAFLFVNHFSEKRINLLLEAASFLEGESVSEGKGNALVLGQDYEALSQKVDEVRELIQSLSLRNWSEGKSRYVLVPYAEKLTVQAANALLKVLEEPPVDTHFLLMAPSRKNLLTTILSRCQILVCEREELESSEASENKFYQAFFEQSYEALTTMARAQISYDWEEFKSLAKDKFFEEAYTGNLDREKWFELFDFTEEISSKIDANADVKWLASAIERFGFHV